MTQREEKTLGQDITVTIQAQKLQDTGLVSFGRKENCDRLNERINTTMDILNEKIEGLVKKARNLECHILYLKRYTIGVCKKQDTDQARHHNSALCTSKLICNKIIRHMG